LNNNEICLEISEEVNSVKQPKTSNQEDQRILNPFKIPDDIISIFFWLIILPLKSLFYFSILDARREKFGKFPYYFITFITSTIYVGILTYGVVWMVVIIGKMTHPKNNTIFIKIK
jgi:hypothetical protein